MNAITSRYRIFDTMRFRNAPLSKLWALSTLAGSLFAIPFRYYRTPFVGNFAGLADIRQVIHLAISKFIVLEFKDIIAGCLLIYFMRQVERRFGSRKYADFLILSGLTALTIELSIQSLCVFFDVFSIDSVQISYGPYALLCSAFVQFYCDVPFVPYATVFNVPLSMLISTKGVIISCLSGLMTGIIYRYNFLGVQSLSILPQFICRSVSSILKPFLDLGENNRGRLLPIGATVEAQRQDFYERYEQSLIYEQIQRQQLSDEQANVTHPLRIGRRLFGAGQTDGGGDNDANRTQPNACEEKVRTLVEMGFSDRTRVEQVLRNTNNDLNSAALVLLQDTGA